MATTLAVDKCFDAPFSRFSHCIQISATPLKCLLGKVQVDCLLATAATELGRDRGTRLAHAVRHGLRTAQKDTTLGLLRVLANTRNPRKLLVPVGPSDLNELVRVVLAQQYVRLGLVVNGIGGVVQQNGSQVAIVKLGTGQEIAHLQDEAATAAAFLLRRCFVGAALGTVRVVNVLQDMTEPFKTGFVASRPVENDSANGTWVLQEIFENANHGLQCVWKRDVVM